jgi:hypothetical protein
VDDDIRPMSGLRREGFGPAPGRMEPEAGAPSGVEWGTASLVLGAVFALMMPPSLILFAAIDGRIGGRDAGVVEAAGYFFPLLILLLSATGAAFGVVGMIAAQRARRPIALGLAGVMLNALSLLMWAGALLAWYTSWR